MSFVECEDKIWTLIESIAHEEGLGIYDLEIRPEPSVFVTVDKLREGEKVYKNTPVSPIKEPREGVTSDDCSKLCRRLMVYFHAEGEELGLGDSPKIDVSSPGLDRALRLEKHYESAIGENVKILLNSSSVKNENGKVFTNPLVGKVVKVSLDSVTVEEERSLEKVSVTFDEIKKAKVKF